MRDNTEISGFVLKRLDSHTSAYIGFGRAGLIKLSLEFLSSSNYPPVCGR